MTHDTNDNPRIPAWADWSDAPPLTGPERHARDRSLAMIRTRIAARRRKRLAARLLAAAIVVVASMAAVRGLRPHAPEPTPIVHVDPPTPTPIPIPPPAPTPTPAFKVTMIATDPTAVARYTITATSTAIMLDDDGLARQLEHAGMPGLIRIGGRVMLSRDLQPPGEDNRPRSQAAPPLDRTTG